MGNLSTVDSFGFLFVTGRLRVDGNCFLTPGFARLWAVTKRSGLEAASLLSRLWSFGFASGPTASEVGGASPPKPPEDIF